MDVFFLVSFDVGWFGGGCCYFEFGAVASNSVQRYFEFDASVSSSMQVFRIRGCSFEFGVSLWNSLLQRCFEFGSVPSNPALFFFRMRCRQSDTGLGRFEFCAVPSQSIDADDAFISNSMKFGGCFSFEIGADAGRISNVTQNFRTHCRSLEFGVVSVFVRSASLTFLLWHSAFNV